MQEENEVSKTLAQPNAVKGMISCSTKFYCLHAYMSMYKGIHVQVDGFHTNTANCFLVAEFQKKMEAHVDEVIKITRSVKAKLEKMDKDVEAFYSSNMIGCMFS